MPDKKSAGAILDRIQQALKLSSDGEVCRVLDIKRSTLGSWRAQDRRPYEICVSLQESHGLSLDWLLTGEGPMDRSGVAEQPAKWEAGLSEQRTRIDALLSLLSQIDAGSREKILSECFARAETAQQLADLRQAVQELEAKARA